MTTSIWKRRVDIWDTALKSQAALVELRDQGYIDAATCADECVKLHDWAVKETEDKEFEEKIDTALSRLTVRIVHNNDA